MRPTDGVRPILNDRQASALNELRGAPSRGCDGHDTVRVTVNDQRGNVNAGQVIAEVFMPRGYAGKTRCGGGAGSEIPAGLHRLFADALAQENIRVVEILEEFGEERVTVCGDRFLDAVEHTAVHALGVV